MSTLPPTRPDAAGEPAPPAPAVATVNQAASPSQQWWRIGDFAVLGIYTSVVLWIIPYHEKWADEAQAWLIARDLDLRTIWFHELRYEGSPGLWHTILWVAQHVFHARYDSIGYIGASFAIAGVALMLFKAPFPRPLRWMLAFTYFMTYQYAVIARPYTLLPLLCFAAACWFPDRAHPERITLMLALLSLLSVHGILMASGIGLAYLVEAAKSWHNLSGPVRKRHVLCVGAMLAVLLFAFVVLKTTPDVDTFAKPTPGVQTVGGDQQAVQALRRSKSARIESIISGALFDFAVPSAIFLVLAGAWCFHRRKLLLFVMLTAPVVLLYMFVHGGPHHHGSAFIAVIAALWVAWPTREEQNASPRERLATQAMVALLACLFAVNIWDAAVSIRYDYLYPYCGSKDAAKYLRSVGADKQSIFGYTYGIAAVQAYFDHNIVRNIPTAYFHHGAPDPGGAIDLGEIVSQKPEYIVFLTQSPTLELPILDRLLQRYGYEMVHFSDGYLFFKRSLADRNVYVIYRRKY